MFRLRKKRHWRDSSFHIFSHPAIYDQLTDDQLTAEQFRLRRIKAWRALERCERESDARSLHRTRGSETIREETGG